MELLKKVKEMIGIGDEAASGDTSKAFSQNSQILMGFQDLVTQMQPAGQEGEASDEEYINRLRKEGSGQ